MNENLRRVIVEETPVYSSDSGAGVYKFKVKKHYDGIDLSTLIAFLKIRFSDESTDKILITDTTSLGDEVILTFKVSDAFSRVAGRADCQLCFENTDGSIIINTEVFTVEILDSVEIESYGQTVLPSAIRLLQTELSEKIDEMNQLLNKVSGMIKYRPVVVSPDNFISGTQVLSVPEATPYSTILIAPHVNPSVMAAAGIYVYDQASGTVTIKYTTRPTDSFTMKVIIFNPVSD